MSEKEKNEKKWLKVEVQKLETGKNEQLAGSNALGLRPLLGLKPSRICWQIGTFSWAPALPHILLKHRLSEVSFCGWHISHPLKNLLATTLGRCTLGVTAHC
ncbi:MAG: hypothetical protein LBC52_00320 [Treponema sp.]|nr:hypothetical protein [Treponema sp.]